MRYLFDIGHPAEAHTFKNVIWNLKKKGHDIMVTARDKDITLYLLDFYKIPYVSTGKNLKSKAGKIYSLLRNDLKILREVIRFNPDIIVNFFSPFAAHAGKIMGKPVIGFHDTEHANISIKLAKPFTDTIVVPSCYQREYPQKNVIKFKGNFELAYLHPKYFIPDRSVPDALGVKENEKYVLLRFVTHTSMHDSGHKGFSVNEKIEIVEKFKRKGKVLISSEVHLPEELKKYELTTPFEKIHDVIYYASLLYGESATMASEAAVLGTPAIFLDFKGRGYTDEEEKYGLVFNFSNSLTDQKRSIEKGVEILNNYDGRMKWKELQKTILNNMIDVTSFMTWFIEDYPESEKIMIDNPGFQLKFK